MKEKRKKNNLFKKMVNQYHVRLQGSEKMATDQLSNGFKVVLEQALEL